MRLDKIYKESSNASKDLKNFDIKCQNEVLSLKLSLERKNKLKKLEEISWELHHLLKKKMKNDPHKFICSIG